MGFPPLLLSLTRGSSSPKFEGSSFLLIFFPLPYFTNFTSLSLPPSPPGSFAYRTKTLGSSTCLHTDSRAMPDRNLGSNPGTPRFPNRGGSTSKGGPMKTIIRPKRASHTSDLHSLATYVPAYQIPMPTPCSITMHFVSYGAGRKLPPRSGCVSGLPEAFPHTLAPPPANTAPPYNHVHMKQRA